MEKCKSTEIHSRLRKYLRMMHSVVKNIQNLSLGMKMEFDKASEPFGSC